MKFIKDLYGLSVILITFTFFTMPLKAQVTIGSQEAPKSFSILELISTTGGLRLPQLSDQELTDLTNNKLSTSDAKEAAKGLVIYNKTTNCLEFWNGDKWISLCQSKLGDGSESDPYLVCSPESLDAMRDKPDAHYKLCQNIDLTDYLATGAGQSKWGGSGWLPIGDATTPFTGSLDGAGYTISGLWIQRPSTGFGAIGLFGYINGGSLKNFSVKLDATKGINGGLNTYVGSVAGRLSGSGSSISNCYVNGGDLRGGNSVGGVAGRVDSGSSGVTCCYASVNVTGANGIGGVVGQISSDVTAERGGSVTNCFATGNIIGTTGVGGVVGRVQISGNVSYCYTTGAISRSAPNTNTNANYLGGVTGRIDNNGTVTNCIALNISVTTTYGNGIGRITGNNSSGTLTNNWALSDMTITDGSGSPKTIINDAGDVDGADMNDTNSKTANWWTSVPGWDSSIWNFVNNQLPKLK